MNIKEYLKAKRETGALKDTQDLVLKILTERLSKEIDIIVEKLQKEISKIEETIRMEMESEIKEYHKYLPKIVEKIRGELPNEQDFVNLIKPLIPLPLKGDSPTKDELLGLIKPLIPKSFIPGIDFDLPKDGSAPSKAELEKLIKAIEPAVTAISDTPEQIANKLNTLEEKIDVSVIKGLKNKLLNLSLKGKKKSSGGGGGMGNWQHESKTVNDSTTTVATSYKIGAGGFAILAFYQGQQIHRGTHYTVGGDRKTLTLTFTPTAGGDTTIDIVYVRS